MFCLCTVLKEETKISLQTSANEVGCRTCHFLGYLFYLSAIFSIRDCNQSPSWYHEGAGGEEKCCHGGQMKACATRAACKGAANDQTDQTAIKINLLQPAVSPASAVLKPSRQIQNLIFICAFACLLVGALAIKECNKFRQKYQSVNTFKDSRINFDWTPLSFTQWWSSESKSKMQISWCWWLCWWPWWTSRHSPHSSHSQR